MSSEIVQLVEQASPYLTAAVGAYGAAVLTRAEDAAADATVTLGQRILGAVWRRRDEEGQEELERVVDEAADEQDESYTVAVLGRLLRLALQDDAELRAELSELLPAPGAGSITITASGERSIAAQHIGNAYTGDGHGTPRP
ncbi:hypothetical protein [Streptomyces cyaneofuscatus]|uniref:Uncharacterized protein n=1 Tax=Streptomyces cyaneofuscatus TaxID=66883 RepID=A0ABZ1EXW8_9ACTN|nr:hypothetical protein [Streptomyces cyaneofuscatus]WSB08975.1 hypothetical protein OG849_17825 [Streptomyces cyaneofuscatus]WSD47491.1 hypothetical protein OG857_17580 [Streptomyces cyaneofuscatus]